MQKTIYFIFLLIVSSCVAEKEETVPDHLMHIENLHAQLEHPTPTADIELIRELSFGDTEEVLFGRMVENIAVDQSGRVYIADLAESTIHVFDIDGSYLQSIGQMGQGPGEFQMIWDFEISDNKIHVLDSQNFRVSVFDLNTFDHIRDYDISLNDRKNNQPSWIDWTREEGLFYRPTSIFVRNDGKYFLLFSDASVGFDNNINIRTYEGSIYDPQKDEFQSHDVPSLKWTGQVLVHQEGEGLRVLFRVPYKRDSFFDFSNNQFVYGWSDEMLFRFHDENGTYQKAIYYSYSNEDFHFDDLINHYEGADDDLIQVLRSDDQPETWPAFQSLIMDDENRLWVSTMTDNQGTYEWWVLEETGNLMAKFSWPRDRDLKLVKNNNAYTLENDEETGVQKVVRYKINIQG